MDSEAQEDSYEKSYRKKFPKGKDWKEPEAGPYNIEGQRIPTSAYHSMEVVGVSIDRYSKLERENKKLEENISTLKNEYYFGIRNKKIEYEMLKKDFSKLVTAMNNLLQENPDDEYIKTVLKDVGILPK